MVKCGRKTTPRPVDPKTFRKFSIYWKRLQPCFWFKPQVFCEAGRNVSSESSVALGLRIKFKVLVVNARHAACQLSEMTEGKGLGETTQL